jgi:hypothetical protein
LDDGKLYICVKWRLFSCITVWYYVQIQSEVSYPNQSYSDTFIVLLFLEKRHLYKD